MFSSALSLEKINGNENLVQTRSSDVFRQQCSELRLELLNIAKNLPESSRIVNLQKWGQDAMNVWTAVQENDDLVMIRDLSHINNHRQMVVALEEFRKIMSKKAPVLALGEVVKNESNPLLTGNVPAEKKAEQVIAQDQTIFCQLTNAIDEALEEQEKRDKSVRLDNFIDDKKRHFIFLKDELEKKYGDHAIHLTEKFGPEL